MTEQLPAAQIVKMIHPDLPPATAHFLLNEAKPLLEWIEAQAEELAKYKQLATTAIDDAVALRAQLAALQLGAQAPVAKAVALTTGIGLQWVGDPVPAGTALYTRALPERPAQDVNAGLVSSWQSMETAPKDGREFIIRYPLQNNVKQLACWGIVHKIWLSKGEAIFPEHQKCEWSPIPSDSSEIPVRAEAALLRVLSAVREYLPPDGTSKDDFISSVISTVDPWPLAKAAPQQEQKGGAL